ncbi:MAG: hypothetical protein HY211_05370 [Candidatus Omnitrophica bacterium]|nr:hypothetical protein [Candidatus Omnitrophota bacterium]
MTRPRIYLRVLDANLNRAREGLRVCEEVARLVLEERRLTRRCQQIRYDLGRLSQQMSRAHPLNGSALLKARDARKDVGRPAIRGTPAAHRGIRDLVTANSQRVQEALRVLEEFTRLRSSPIIAKAFSALRFRVYSVEQDLLSRL